MNDDFHAHLVGMNLKTQESNMHEELKEMVKKYLPHLLTEERYGTSRFTEFTSMRSVKDMDSKSIQRRSCCFAYCTNGVSISAK